MIADDGENSPPEQVEDANLNEYRSINLVLDRELKNLEASVQRRVQYWEDQKKQESRVDNFLAAIEEISQTQMQIIETRKMCRDSLKYRVHHLREKAAEEKAENESLRSKLEENFKNILINYENSSPRNKHLLQSLEEEQKLLAEIKQLEEETEEIRTSRFQLQATNHQHLNNAIVNFAKYALDWNRYQVAIAELRELNAIETATLKQCHAEPTVAKTPLNHLVKNKKRGGMRMVVARRPVSGDLNARLKSVGASFKKDVPKVAGNLPTRCSSPKKRFLSRFGCSKSTAVSAVHKAIVSGEGEIPSSSKASGSKALPLQQVLHKKTAGPAVPKDIATEVKIPSSKAGGRNAVPVQQVFNKSTGGLVKLKTVATGETKLPSSYKVERGKVLPLQQALYKKTAGLAVPEAVASGEIEIPSSFETGESKALPVQQVLDRRPNKVRVLENRVLQKGEYEGLKVSKKTATAISSGTFLKSLERKSKENVDVASEQAKMKSAFQGLQLTENQRRVHFYNEASNNSITEMTPGFASDSTNKGEKGVAFDALKKPNRRTLGKFAGTPAFNFQWKNAGHDGSFSQMESPTTAAPFKMPNIPPEKPDKEEKKSFFFKF